MQKRDYILYIEDMLDSIKKIELYLHNLTKSLPESYYLNYPEIPWTKMYRLRNIVSHHYHGIDYEMIWEISKKHLPQNKLDLKKIIDKEKKIIE